jgi:hydrogenase maturation protein HypF
MSTRAAAGLVAKYGARVVAIQHHAAHAFGVMAEHGVEEAVALVCDGTGYGTDGTIWGGEVLKIEGAAWKRVGHLRAMRLPGGDAAARDPRRSGLALLAQAFGEGFEKLPAVERLLGDAGERYVLSQMIRTGFNSPWTSSTGRLFDGFAALLGVCGNNQHESQAPMALEAAAVGGECGADHTGGDGFELAEEGGEWVLGMAPLVRAVAEQAPGCGEIGQYAARFHRVLAEGWMGMIEKVISPGVPVVVSGGTMVNQVLLGHLVRLAGEKHIRLLVPRLYPPTDAGLAFGQAALVLRQGRAA